MFEKTVMMLKLGGNAGLFNRYWATRGGKIVDLEGPLFIDLFQQPRLLVNGVSIGIKLWPSHDAFRLVTDSINPAQKVQIEMFTSNYAFNGSTEEL